MNDASSRSHLVFWLSSDAVHHGQQQLVRSNLFLVDLAGSERVKRSAVSGERLAEASAINKSLSALTDVFAALAKKSAHVPYRNSKLTWLLQPCLAGHGKALLLVNVSSCSADAAETICTLRMGCVASTVQLGKPQRSITVAPPVEAPAAT